MAGAGPGAGSAGGAGGRAAGDRDVADHNVAGYLDVLGLHAGDGPGPLGEDVTQFQGAGLDVLQVDADGARRLGRVLLHRIQQRLGQPQHVGVAGGSGRAQVLLGHGAAGFGQRGPPPVGPLRARPWRTCVRSGP